MMFIGIHSIGQGIGVGGGVGGGGTPADPNKLILIIQI